MESVADTVGVAESLKSKDSQNLWLRSWNYLKSIATLLFLFFLILIAHPSLCFQKYVSLYKSFISKGNLSELSLLGSLCFGEPEAST